jgi:hypothetical protein
MGEIVLFSFLSALYPTLIAATTVMLLLPKPERLMLGFWLGAMITSVTLGLVIVLALHGSRAVKTTRHTVRPPVRVAAAVTRSGLRWLRAPPWSRARLRGGVIRWGSRPSGSA